jgi:hypothetical protein
MDEQKKKQVIFGIVVIIALFILFSNNSTKIVNDLEKPTKYLATVQPIVNAEVKPEDAVELSKFYLSFAGLVEKDGSDGDEKASINSLTFLAELHGNAGKNAFENTPIYQSYENLRELIDDSIAVSVGSQKKLDGKYTNVNINSVNRNEIVNCFRAMAWACLENASKK